MPQLTALPLALIWLVLVLLFLAAEAATVGLVSLWFALGALAGLVAALVHAPPIVQFWVFLIVSLLSLGIVRPMAKHWFTPKDLEPTNADRFLGKEAIVTQEIDNLRATGQVKIGGLDWTARSEDPHRTIPKGERVVVLRIEGVKLLVAPKRPEAGSGPSESV